MQVSRLWLKFVLVSTVFESQVDEIFTAHAQAFVQMETELTRAATAAIKSSAEITSLCERVAAWTARDLVGGQRMLSCCLSFGSSVGFP